MLFKEIYEYETKYKLKFFYDNIVKLPKRTSN